MKCCSRHSPLLLPAASTDEAPPPAFTPLLLLLLGGDGVGVGIRGLEVKVVNLEVEGPGLPGAAPVVAGLTLMAPLLVGGDLTWAAAAGGGCGRGGSGDDGEFTVSYWQRGVAE